ncbi:hypothetical protein KEM60_00237 [Austwickia sp. TVS 96-490-7B]|uniref:hypothetical protein n=1 Tax=Austwickia sp. TVS 96-490-7B TaxID=2830843 RepID=UPI001C58064E|nr:hypothetical protein [Austwickia sp. TVS 96-490-7B]MBW3084054.1 hypothetical protein [Austwickia sp. TVS 96-490-7B]
MSAARRHTAPTDNVHRIRPDRRTDTRWAIGGAAHEPQHTTPCPTCGLTADSPDDTATTTSGVAPATCHDCGITSIDYGLTLAIDALVHDAHGWDALSQAVFASADTIAVPHATSA